MASSRKIAIKYQVQGNKAVVRAMKQIEGSTKAGGTAAASATEKEESFSAALIKRSAMADKALKKTESLFAGTDRLLSIVGKVTGAIGLGVIAYKVAGAAIDLFTQKQKKAALAAKAHSAALKEQARRIGELARFRSASGGFAASLGVDTEKLQSADREEGGRLFERATRARAALVEEQARFDVAAQKLRAFANTGDMENAERVRRQQGGDRATKRLAALRAERASLDAAVERTSKRQEHLRDLSLKASGELKVFSDELRADLEAVKDPAATDTGGGGGGGKSKPKKREETPDWLTAEIRLYVAGIERAKQLHAALESLRPSWEAMVITPANVTAAAAALQESLGPLLPFANAATVALGGVADRLAAIGQEMIANQGAAEIWNAELERMSQFGGRVGDSLAGAAIDAAFFGGSVSKMLGELASAAAREAGIEALKSTAKGFAAAASPVTAALAPGHFKAAAMWGAVGVAAGVVSAATGGGGGGGGGGGALASPTRRDLPKDKGGGDGVTINVTMDLKSRPFATDRDVEDAMLRGTTSALRRAGGAGRAFRREVAR